MKNKLLFTALVSVLYASNAQASYLIPSLSSQSKTIIALSCVYVLYDLITILSFEDSYQEHALAMWYQKKNIKQPTPRGIPECPTIPKDYESLLDTQKAGIERKLHSDTEMWRTQQKSIDSENDRNMQEYTEAQKFITTFPDCYKYASCVEWQKKKDLIIERILLKSLGITLLALCVTKYM